MKLVSAKVTHPRPTKPFSTLDDAEMLLTLNDLGESQPPVPQSLISPDLLVEYASAASMIMEKEEREAIARELLQATMTQPIAA